MTGFWDDADVISIYTREQAIEDGVLVPTTALAPDEPDFAEQAGFTVPVALTAAVAALVLPTELERADGQDVKGRLWDVLNMARVYKRPGGEWLFPCIFAVTRDRDGVTRRSSKTFHLKCHVGPGDGGEPVVTIMLGHED